MSSSEEAVRKGELRHLDPARPGPSAPQDQYWAYQPCLKTNQPDFASFVMKRHELEQRFAHGRTYRGEFCYPFLVQDTFQNPVIFSRVDTGDDRFLLKTAIVTNRQPAACATKMAKFFRILKAVYAMIDEFTNNNDPEHGHGEGSIIINSRRCERPDGTEDPWAGFFLSVADRPGLFLKVAKADGTFYDNVQIFFPAQIEGGLHSAVHLGEAFVMVETGTDLTEELIRDINNTFNYLVNRSYGADQGLYSLRTHQHIEQVLGDEMPWLEEGQQEAIRCC